MRRAPASRADCSAAASIAVLLDREESGRSRPLGRALDLGCGRGLYTPELARRGWEAVGIDHVPAAIEAAQAKSPGAARLSYLVGDVTQLPVAPSLLTLQSAVVSHLAESTQCPSLPHLRKVAPLH